MTKHTTIKLLLLFSLIFVPFIFAFFFTKNHSYIESNNTLHTKYLPYFKEGTTVLYIGYTGCVYICTPRLFEIASIQRAINHKQKNAKLNYMFLDIRSLGDDVSEDFLKAFDAKIDVLSLPSDLKNELKRELNFYSSKSLYDTNEYEHSSYLYILENDTTTLTHTATIMQYPFNNKNTIDFILTKAK